MKYNKLLEEADSYLKAATELDKKGQYHEVLEQAQIAVDYYFKLAVWDKYVKAKMLIGINNHVVLAEKSAVFNYWKETLKEALGYLGNQHEYIVDCYRYIGVTYSRFGDLPKGLTFLKKGYKLILKLEGEHEFKKAVLHNDLGLSYLQQGIRDQAFQHLKEGLDILTQLLKKSQAARQTSSGEENIRINLARNAYILGQFYSNNELYDEALEHLHSALAISEKIYGKEHPSLCPIFILIASCYTQKNDTQLAISHAESSLYLIKKHYGENGFQMGSACNIMSTCLQKKGEYDKALQYSKKSVELLKTHLGEKHRDTTFAYTDLAIVYTELGQYKEAAVYYNKAIAIQQDIFSKDSYKLVPTYMRMGNNFFRAQKFDKAIQCYQKTLNICLQTWGEKNISVANSYLYMGHTFANQGEYAKALRLYQNSLQAICKDFEGESIYINPETYEHFFASTLFEILHTKADTLYQQYLQSNKKKDYQGAINTYQSASNVLDSMRKSFQSEDSQLMLSQEASKAFYENGILAALNSFSHFNHTDLAFHFAEKAKASLLLLNLQHSFAKVRSSIPRELLRQEKDLKIKLTILKKSIQQEEIKKASREGNQLQELRNRFFDLHRTYLRFLDQLEENYPDYYRLKYDTQTVTLRELQFLLHQNQVVISYFVGKEKLYVFVVTDDEFEVIDLQLPADFENLVQGFMDALTQHQYAAFKEKSHQLYQLLIAPIRDFIVDDFGFGDNDEGGDLKQVFVIPHGVLSYVPFEALSPQPYRLLRHPRLARREAVAKVSAVMKNSPTKDVEEIGTPEGFGDNSPFEGGKGDVQSGNNWNNLDYLLHHCQISYHYSATLLYRHLLKKQTEEELPNSFAGFAPIYDISIPSKSNTEIKIEVEQADILQQSAKTMQQWATRSEAIRSDGTWVSLPHSETEAKGIAQLFEEKGLKTETFLREKASKEGFAEAAKRFKFLLVAAHGLVNDEKTALSGLVFYPSTGEYQIPNIEYPISNKKHRTLNNEHLITNNQSLITNHQTDNILSMEETHHLDLQADLVVLSSCESGIGKLHKGEGMMAVNRGFLAAGANNVVSTLFKVYDKPSSLLTQYLFEGILEGESYASALRLAKLKLMQQANIDPKSWSGFVLIGG